MYGWWTVVGCVCKCVCVWGVGMGGWGGGGVLPYMGHIEGCAAQQCKIFVSPSLNPFTPKSDECQISLAASLEILRHTV